FSSRRLFFFFILCAGSSFGFYARFVRDRLSGPPFEQREKPLHAIHELHGLPAARITAFRAHVPALLCEKRQVLTNVAPRIRVLATGLSEHARIFEMSEAHVVRSDGEPGAVRLGNAGGN